MGTEKGHESLLQYLTSLHPETISLNVILRSKATKNLMATMPAEILRGVYPEPAEGLGMTLGSFRVDTNFSGC